MANKAFRALERRQYKQLLHSWSWPNCSESLPTHEMLNNSVPVKALNICLCLGKPHTTVIRCNYISTKAFPLKCFPSKGPALTDAKPVGVKHAVACVLWSSQPELSSTACDAKQWMPKRDKPSHVP